MSKELPRVFGYVVNADERGMFNADVRDLNDKTVFEVSSDPEEGGAIWQIDAGYMKHGRDLNGLKDYLVEMGTLKSTDHLLNEQDFNRLQERFIKHEQDQPNNSFEI